MKKLSFLLFVLLIATASVATAQTTAAPPATSTTSGSATSGTLVTTPGTFTIGSRLSGDLLNWTATLPQPNFGVFIIPNLELSFTFFYTSDTTDYNQSGVDDSEDKRMGLSIGVNYYMPFRGNLHMVFGGALAYMSQEDEDGDGQTIKGIILTAGLAYAFTPNFVLEGGVNLHYLMGDQDGSDTETSSFGLQLGYFGVKGFF